MKHENHDFKKVYIAWSFFQYFFYFHYFLFAVETVLSYWTERTIAATTNPLAHSPNPLFLRSHIRDDTSIKYNSVVTRSSMGILRGLSYFYFFDLKRVFNPFTFRERNKTTTI